MVYFEHILSKRLISLEELETKMKRFEDQFQIEAWGLHSSRKWTYQINEIPFSNEFIIRVDQGDFDLRELEMILYSIKNENPCLEDLKLKVQRMINDRYTFDVPKINFK